jgi:putative oxygen-independent coproporphyrinogen III oxidase
VPLGLYISVPFCRTKCSYCNFVSGVFSQAVYQRYVNRVCEDIENAPKTATQLSAEFEASIDSIYLGGGTPTVLDINQLEQLFVTISQNFQIAPDAEITVECAPGTLTPALIEILQRSSVNRVSLGVQSFVDAEARSVGRLHTRETALQDIQRLRHAGISNLNIDLIAGLPHQTRETWQFSLNEALSSGVPHISVYMLEVDDDSRLGRELIAGGTKYHAHFVPDDELTTDLYEEACSQLNEAGILQYEISNFARPSHESRHNLKYWTRQPYFGFGVDAHSMLPSASRQKAIEAIRFATPDSLEQYLAGATPQTTVINPQSALEEEFFLGLRLARGVDLSKIASLYGEDSLSRLAETIHELCAAGLLQLEQNIIRLTPRGRLLSNEVFERFLASEPAPNYATS